jgi:hypothetical protein
MQNTNFPTFSYCRNEVTQESKCQSHHLIRTRHFLPATCVNGANKLVQIDLPLFGHFRRSMACSTMMLMNYPLILLSESTAVSVEVVVDNARRPVESRTEAKLARDRAERPRLRSRSLSHDRVKRSSSRSRSKSQGLSCRWEPEKHPRAISCQDGTDAATASDERRTSLLRHIPRMPVRQMSSRLRMPERQASKGKLFSDTVDKAISRLRMPIRQISRRHVETMPETKSDAVGGMSSPEYPLSPKRSSLQKHC